MIRLAGFHGMDDPFYKDRYGAKVWVVKGHVYAKGFDAPKTKREDTRMMQTEWRRESLVIAQTVKAHAEARGMTAGQFAVNWVLNNRAVTAALAGPRTLAQWQDYLGALEHAFNAEDEALIDDLVVTGHPSTPGYNDPAYPIEGRETWT